MVNPQSSISESNFLLEILDLTMSQTSCHSSVHSPLDICWTRVQANHRWNRIAGWIFSLDLAEL